MIKSFAQGHKVSGKKQRIMKIREKLIDVAGSMVVTRGEEGWREEKRVKGG